MLVTGSEAKEAMLPAVTAAESEAFSESRRGAVLRAASLLWGLVNSSVLDVMSLPKSLDMLVERIRVSHERTEHGRHEWIEGTLELAAALAEARDRLPSNSAFAACLHCVYKSIAAWISRRRCHKQKPACTHSAGGLFPCELVAKHFALTTDKINQHNSSLRTK
jgi:hypothetical protein